MKFTPEEMAIDAADVDASKPSVASSRKQWERFLSLKRGYVRLDPDLRRFYDNDRNINSLLRQLMELAKKSNSKNRKKSA